jgi:hypothetical protein
MRSVGLGGHPLLVYPAVRLEAAELTYSTAYRAVSPTSGDPVKLDAGDSTAGTRDWRSLADLR